MRVHGLWRAGVVLPGLLLSSTSGGSVIDAPSIVNGTVYWGSGYRRIGGTGNNKVYAFSVPKSK